MSRASRGGLSSMSEWTAELSLNFGLLVQHQQSAGWLVVVVVVVFKWTGFGFFFLLGVFWSVTDDLHPSIETPAVCPLKPLKQVP